MLIPRRDLDFQLYDVLDCVAGLVRTRSVSAEHDRAVFDGVLDTAYRIAAERFAPFAAACDVDEPRIVDGRAWTIPETRAALAAYNEASFTAATFDADDGGLQLPLAIAQGLHGRVLERERRVPFLRGADRGRRRPAGDLRRPRSAPALRAADAGRPVHRDDVPVGTACRLLACRHPLPGPAAPTTAATASRARRCGSPAATTTSRKRSCTSCSRSCRARRPACAASRSSPCRAIASAMTRRSASRTTCGSRAQPQDGLARHDQCRALLRRARRLPRGTRRRAASRTRVHVPDDECGPHRRRHERGRARLRGLPRGARLRARAAAGPSARARRTRRHRRCRSCVTPTCAGCCWRRNAGSKAALRSCSIARGSRTRSAARPWTPLDAHGSTGLLELLTPIAKSWPSEYCLEANKLAIQVHGGYGYTRDFPVERLYRDNRLNHIHEGTHGIHGLDLLGRKVAMHGGAALQELFRADGRDVGEQPLVLRHSRRMARLSRTAAADVAATTASDPGSDGRQPRARARQCDALSGLRSAMSWSPGAGWSRRSPRKPRCPPPGATTVISRRQARRLPVLLPARAAAHRARRSASCGRWTTPALTIPDAGF